MQIIQFLFIEFRIDLKEVWRMFANQFLIKNSMTTNQRERTSIPLLIDWILLDCTNQYSIVLKFKWVSNKNNVCLESSRTSISFVSHVKAYGLCVLEPEPHTKWFYNSLHDFILKNFPNNYPLWWISAWNRKHTYSISKESNYQLCND